MVMVAVAARGGQQYVRAVLSLQGTFPHSLCAMSAATTQAAVGSGNNSDDSASDGKPLLSKNIRGSVLEQLELLDTPLTQPKRQMHQLASGQSSVQRTEPTATPLMDFDRASSLYSTHRNASFVAKVQHFLSKENTIAPDNYNR